ncbi:DUF1490 family protein [Albitalea terrae]|uniref:DUF1490 family protein n=1 Tax=Piscinibacter terrae TaxID=2496871 RepID=A0A3N7K7Q2_9BURK|nr:DUF1490 family protein [Albitalea terrae]
MRSLARVHALQLILQELRRRLDEAAGETDGVRLPAGAGLRSDLVDEFVRGVDVLAHAVELLAQELGGIVAGVVGAVAHEAHVLARLDVADEPLDACALGRRELGTRRTRTGECSDEAEDVAAVDHDPSVTRANLRRPTCTT